MEFATGSRGQIHEAEALPMVEVTPTLAVHHQSLSQECKLHVMVASHGCELTDVFGCFRPLFRLQMNANEWLSVPS